MDAIAGRIRTRHFVAVRFGVLAASLIAFAACDSNNTRLVVAGSVLQPSSSIGFSPSALSTQIQPQFLVRHSIAGFGCPVLPPLTTTFTIVVLPRVDVHMNEVKLRFIDGSNIGGSPIPFPQGDLNRMFGDTFIRAHTSRAFVFTPRFGCFPVSPTWMSAQIAFADMSGASQEMTINANIQ